MPQARGGGVRFPSGVANRVARRAGTTRSTRQNVTSCHVATCHLRCHHFVIRDQRKRLEQERPRQIVPKSKTERKNEDSGRDQCRVLQQPRACATTWTVMITGTRGRVERQEVHGEIVPNVPTRHVVEIRLLDEHVAVPATT